MYLRFGHLSYGMVIFGTLLLCMAMGSRAAVADCPEYKYTCGTGEKFTVGNCWQWGTLSCSKRCGKPVATYCEAEVAPKYLKRHRCDPYVRSDGCSVPRDLPVGLQGFTNDFAVFFRPACNQHDAAYSTKGMSKDDADKLFLHDMKLLCSLQPLPFQEKIAAYTGNRKNLCPIMAQAFYEAVKSKGAEAYKKDQKWAKNHCH